MTEAINPVMSKANTSLHKMLGSAGSYIVTQLGLFVNFCRIIKARGSTGRGLLLCQKSLGYGTVRGASERGAGRWGKVEQRDGFGKRKKGCIAIAFALVIQPLLN